MQTGKRPDTAVFTAEILPGLRERSTPELMAATDLCSHVEPDITMEIFFVDRPLDGVGDSRSVNPDSATNPASRGETAPSDCLDRGLARDGRRTRQT
jgi:hypothetical protein